MCAGEGLGEALLAGSPGRDTELRSSWRCGHGASGRDASRPQPHSNSLFSCSITFKEHGSDRHNKYARFKSRRPPHSCAETSVERISDYSTKSEDLAESL